MNRKIVCLIGFIGGGLGFNTSASAVGIHYVIDNSLITEDTTIQDREDEIDFWTSEINTIYKNSGVALRISTVRVTQSDITDEETINDIADFRVNIDGEVQGFQGLEATAMAFGADYTIAIVPDLIAINNVGTIFGLCGAARQVSDTLDEINAVNFVQTTAVMDMNCGSSTLVHEIGHVMGLAHGDQVSLARDNVGHSEGIEDYSMGWGMIVDLDSDDQDTGNEVLDVDEYGTIMVGNHVAHWTGTTWGNVKVPLFSNPDIFDELCGIERNGDGDPILDAFGMNQPLACGDDDRGDASRALDQYAANYNNHETIDVHAIEYSSNQLQACVQQQYPNDATNDNTDVDNIWSIDCQNQSINSIRGLEKIEGLAAGVNGIVPQILFNGNLFVNLGPLLGVHVDSTIDLTGNNIANCHELETLQGTHSNLVSPESCLNVAALFVSINLLL